MSQNWKTIRVFISSTFRDMQAERDHLVRLVFPELKERCRKRHIQLIDVDLRWGVTEKEAEGGGALDICLDNIDTCRPYFLGLLGQRYGYVPPDHSHSITAMEIYHGVLHNNLPLQLIDLRPFAKGDLEERKLNKEQVDCLTRCYQWNPEKRKYILKENVTSEEVETLRSIFYGYSIYHKDRSFFFFRSESLTRELAGSKIEDYIESDESTKAKLARLKQEIIDAGLPYFEYQDIETFGQKVLETLWARISAEFPEERKEAKRDWLKEETEFHELFMADRTRRFVGRSEILERMQAFVEEDSNSQVMAITGEPGCGKSALMARFTEKIIRHHPDLLIISHFVGASPSSTSIRQTLRRFCTELNRALGVSVEVPEEYKELVQLFPKLLKRAAESRHILLVIDALNQFERADNAHEMRWLPQQLPRNVKVIVSTLAGEVLDTLRVWRVQPRFEELGGLKEPETELFVKGYLEEVRKEFPTPEIRDAFFDKIRVGHPLYILVALEELRVFPVYEELGNRVDSLPDTVPELFDQMLDRVEADFNKSLVQDFLSFIACGRQGMTGEELQELLGKYTPLADSEGLAVKLPDMLFSRLRRAFSAYLFERSGVIDFFHGQLKEAVGKRYLSAESDRITMHGVVAEYFERRWREPYLRAVDELPHQLTKAEAWEGLESVLCNLNFVEAKCASSMTYDLVHDYDIALETLPEAQTEVQERSRHEARIKKYTDDLIGFAKGEIYHLSAIASVEPWSEEKIEQDTERILSIPTRLDRIRAFSQFVNSESHNLSVYASYPGFAFQQAYNSVYNGPIGNSVQPIVVNEKNLILLLHISYQRLKYNPHPALLKTLQGHSKTVSCVDLTSDGKKAISGSWDKTLKVWNVQSGECIRTLQGNTHEIECVSLTPDGKTAISGSWDTLDVWDVESGECVRTLQGHTYKVFCVDLTPDGKTAISGSWDKTLKVWNVQSGECVRTLQGHEDYVYGACLSADGKTAVSASRDRTLKIWDIESGECLKTLQGHIRPVYCVSLTPYGKTAISRSDDGSLKVWDVESGKCINTLNDTGHVGCVSLTPDGKSVISASDSTLKFWDIESGKCLKTLHETAAYCVGLTPDGKTAISGSWDKTLKIWDVERGNYLKTLQHPQGLSSMRFTPDGTIAISGSLKGNLKVWDVESGECIKTLKGHTDRVHCLSLTPDGKRAISGSWDKTLKIWDVEGGKCLRTLHDTVVDYLSLTPDGKSVISASDSTLKFWDIESGKCLKTLHEIWLGTDQVHCVRWALDGIIAVTSSNDNISRSDDNTLKVWDVERGKCLRTLKDWADEIECVGLTPDGRTAIYGIDDSTLKVWDVMSGECIKTLQGHLRPAYYVSLTPDGGTAISASYDGSLRVWDVDSGECINTLNDIDHVGCVSLTADEKIAVSGSVRGILKVWNIETGECLAVYPANEEIIGISRLTTSGHFSLQLGESVVFIRARNLIVDIPLVTPVRLCLNKQEGNEFGKGDMRLGWEENVKVACKWCGERFPVPEEKLELTRSFNRNAQLSFDRSPSQECSSDVWKESNLFMECPICCSPLKLDFSSMDKCLIREDKGGRSEVNCVRGQEFEARQCLEQGLRLEKQGFLNGAKDAYDKALIMNPQLLLAWVNKGFILYRLSQFDEALLCYERALELDPEDVEVWSSKGNIFFRLGRYVEALDCYDEALAVNPYLAEVWSNKANSLCMLNRFAEAIKCCDKALEINPQGPHAWLYKGVAEDQLGLQNDAVKSYLKYVELAPPEFSQNVEKVRQRLRQLDGKSYGNFGRFDDNRQDYDKPIENIFEGAEYWYNKGNSLYKLHHFDEAIECYNKALEINPYHTETWFMKGTADEQLGKRKDAEISYRRFIEVASPAKFAEYIKVVNKRLQELEGS